jgi:imidazolonepropionase
LNLIIKNISQLVTVASHGEPMKRGRMMGEIEIVRNAAVLCRDGKIAWVGPMASWEPPAVGEVHEIDASGLVAIPGFVDSHTHMMFAGSREAEFALRSQGATYQEIAEQGGGIVHTVRSVRSATKKQLKRSTARYLSAMMIQGTTAVEIKSGYGLDMDNEIKMLEGINELAQEEVMTVIPTFMGAHAIPPEYRDRREAYVDLVLHTMLPYVGKKRLATFCDVFCERGYFDLVESERILTEGKRWGLAPKVHAEELASLGGAELAARIGAVSADHLEHVSDDGIRAMRDAGVVATVLPGVSFFLNHGYAPARKMIDEGLGVAIASDFNPGSCMSFSMPLMMTIACTQMRMSPEEALAACTLNGAAALGLSDRLGSIEVGKQADIVLADVPDYRYLAYHFGTNHVRTVVKNGTILEF